MLPFRKVFFTALYAAAATAAGNGYGQAVPTASAPPSYAGFELPTVNGSLRYSLTASETILSGYNGDQGRGASTYTSFSGNLAYLSKSEQHPFSAIYSAGYLVGGSTFPSYTYQTLSLSQGLRAGRWNFLVADTVDYTPQTPIGSLSGIPGTGDLGLSAVQASTGTGVGILTTYATRVSNAVSGTASRALTSSNTFAVTGGYQLQRYLGSSTGFQGIDNDEKLASASFQHRLNARSNVGVVYSYTNSGFSTPLLAAANYGYQTHTVLGTYNRQISRRFSLYAAAGPQWVLGGTGATTQSTAATISANAGLTYVQQHYIASVGYSRGVNNGNGVVIGSLTDTVTANISRSFDRIFSVAGLVGYNHSQQLGNSIFPGFDSSSVLAGGQFSAQIRRPLSVFTSYTVQHQNFNGYTPAGIAFNGTTQFVSFGVTYSPKPFFNRK